MFNMLIIFIILTLISNILMMINLLISKKNKNREKYSPFECGFDPKNLSRMPFSMHFFLLALIFLIFDVEIILFIPMIFMFKMNMNLLILNYIMIYFIIILMWGLLHEWWQGSLNWTI